jgi:hypothetical protein
MILAEKIRAKISKLFLASLWQEKNKIYDIAQGLICFKIKRIAID